MEKPVFPPRFAEEATDELRRKLALLMAIEAPFFFKEGTPMTGSPEEPGGPVDDEVEAVTDILFRHERADYLVLEEYEAEEEMNNRIKNFVDDEVRPQIPEPYWPYFNLRDFTDDMKMEGYGMLATHDGEERDANVDGYEFLIYKI